MKGCAPCDGDCFLGVDSVPDAFVHCIFLVLTVDGGEGILSPFSLSFLICCLKLWN